MIELAILHPDLNTQLNILLLPTGGKALDAISCSQKCTPQEELPGPVFSAWRIAGNASLILLRFPPDSVKPLLRELATPFLFSALWGSEGIREFSS